MSRNKKKPPSSPKTITVTPIRDEDEDEIEETPPHDDGADPVSATTGPGRVGRTDPETFWKFTAEYPSKKTLTFYFYRLEPNIDRTRTHGDACETSIDKVLCVNGKVPDLNWLKQRWGSGRYHVRVRDTGLRPVAIQNIADSIIDIDDFTEFPPVFEDLRQIVDNSKNASFIQGLIAKKQMYRDAQGVLQVSPQAGQPRNGTSNDDGVSAKLVDLIDKKLSQGPNKIEEAASVAAINTLASSFQGIMTNVIAQLGGNGKSKDGDALTTMLLTNMLQTQQALLVKMLDSAGAPKESGGGFTLREALKEVREIVTTVAGGDFTPGDGAGRSPWEAAIQAAVTAFAPGVNSWLARSAAQMPANGGGRQPQQPTTIPGIPASAPAPPVATAAAPAGAPADQPPPPEEQFSDIPSVPGGLPTRELHQLAKEVYKCLQRGIDGRDWALHLDVGADFAYYTRIRDAVKSGAVQEQFLKDPALVATFSAYAAQLQKFMLEFIDYGGKDDNGDNSSGFTPPDGATADHALAAAAS